MCLNKAKLDSDSPLYSVTAAYVGLPSLPKSVVQGSFYSFKVARASSEVYLVERRLSFAVEVTTASGNWKHPLPFKINFSVHFQWHFF